MLLLGRVPSESRCHQTAQNGPPGWNRRDVGRSITDSFSHMQRLRERGHEILALIEVTTHIARRQPIRPEV
jgi:hypothetical protein